LSVLTSPSAIITWRAAGYVRTSRVCYPSLRRHYREELDTGHIKATAKVSEFLFRKATTEGPQCVTAAIFWMKTRGGWRETPLEHHVDLAVRDLSSVSDEELMRVIDLSGLQAPVINGSRA
jgi:hypothetical protein